MNLFYSMIMLMLTLLGPFMMDASGKLTANPYSWNNISNMLYIDQPVGSGYSYTTGYRYLYRYSSSSS